jgi:paraquat-inducible protein A
MLRGGNVAIGLVLLFFSVLFPIAKLIALRAALHDLRAGREQTRLAPIATRLGKFSMVDVFVLALLVITAKSFPGGSTVEIRWGAWAFAAAAFAPIPVGLAITRPPERDPDPSPA